MLEEQWDVGMYANGISSIFPCARFVSHTYSNGNVFFPSLSSRPQQNQFYYIFIMSHRTSPINFYLNCKFYNVRNFHIHAINHWEGKNVYKIERNIACVSCVCMLRSHFIIFHVSQPKYMVGRGATCLIFCMNNFRNEKTKRRSRMRFPSIHFS